MKQKYKKGRGVMQKKRKRETPMLTFRHYTFYSDILTIHILIVFCFRIRMTEPICQDPRKKYIEDRRHICPCCPICMTLGCPLALELILLCYIPVQTECFYLPYVCVIRKGTPRRIAKILISVYLLQREYRTTG